MNKSIHVIGAGLAGAEAAFRLSQQEIPVVLWEMKPHKFSPAHKLNGFAELVCSNSFRAENPENAVGLLKKEMLALNSLIIQNALKCRVPAGGALAVDRELFSQQVTQTLKNCKNIKIINEELSSWPETEKPIIVAAGPLISDSLYALINKTINQDQGLFFYDALAPIVNYDSLNLEKIFLANRYEEIGQGDYLNAPFTEEEFTIFQEALIAADEVTARSFEKEKYFEACLPIEVMAKRGKRTLTFGPLKPVGFQDPKTGKRPYAVVQLRRENKSGTLWNLVGFQTRLKQKDQKEVFKLIPGLENVTFARYGAIHRNSYLNAPLVLDTFQRLKNKKNVFIAGQLSGVEGYVESAASGIMVAENAARVYKGKAPVLPPPTTALGALFGHLTYQEHKNFAPSNVNFGLFAPAPPEIKKNQKKQWLLNKAQTDFQIFLKSLSS